MQDARANYKYDTKLNMNESPLRSLNTEIQENNFLSHRMHLRVGVLGLNEIREHTVRVYLFLRSDPAA
jgi:hypothetical protein